MRRPLHFLTRSAPRLVEDAQILTLFADPTTREAAFAHLMRKYQSRLYWHVRKMVVDHDDADDLLQEIFVKVWRALPNFRQDAQLFTWLYRIATNECLSHLSSRKRKFLLPMTEASEEIASRLAADEMPEADDIERKLQQAILALPDKLREKTLLTKAKALATKLPLVRHVLALWNSFLDPATPLPVKATILLAVAYFVLPFDLIPDLIAGLGFVDDTAVVLGTIRLRRRPDPCHRPSTSGHHAIGPRPAGAAHAPSESGRWRRSIRCVRTAPPQPMITTQHH